MRIKIKSVPSAEADGFIFLACPRKTEPERRTPRAPRAPRPPRIHALRVRVRRRDFSTVHPCTDEKRRASCAPPCGFTRRRPPLHRDPEQLAGSCPQNESLPSPFEYLGDSRSAIRLSLLVVLLILRRKASRAPEARAGARPVVEHRAENCSCIFGISAIHGGQMCEFGPARSCRGAQGTDAASSHRRRRRKWFWLLFPTNRQERFEPP